MAIDTWYGHKWYIHKWAQSLICNLCFLIPIPTFMHTISLLFPPSLEQFSTSLSVDIYIHIQNKIIRLAGDNNEKFIKFLSRVLE